MVTVTITSKLNEYYPTQKHKSEYPTPHKMTESITYISGKFCSLYIEKLKRTYSPQMLTIRDAQRLSRTVIGDFFPDVSTSKPTCYIMGHIRNQLSISIVIPCHPGVYIPSGVYADFP